MNTYSMFKVDETKEKHGIWVRYGDIGDFLVARVGSGSSDFDRLWKVKRKPYRRQIEQEIIDDKVFSHLLLETFASTALLGWRNVRDANDCEIPFSRTNAVELLTDLPELGLALFNAASDYQNFLIGEREEYAKNYETA